MKRIHLNLLTALNLSAIVTAALSAPSAGAEITSDVAPPPARIERFAPRDGYIWASGYWEWTRRSYHWVSGTYLLERHGAHWVPDRWEQAGAHWQYAAGHWERPLPLSTTAGK
jgi:hypothetical protein